MATLQSSGKGTSGLSDTLSHKSVFDKQRAAVEKLRAQNAKLKEELLLENKFSVRPSRAGDTALINKLQDEADLFTRKIELEKRKVGMLTQQLEAMQKQVNTSRQQMGGVTAAKDAMQSVQKQIKVLENRLEKAYIKYNEGLTYNKQLRQTIDNLRMERMMFENINITVERELARLRKSMADLMTQSNEAALARDKANSEAHAIKMQADKEQQGYEEEWKQLTLIIEEDRKQREYQRSHEMAEREKRTQELLKSCEASQQQRKKVLKQQWNIGVSKALAQNMSHEKVEMYTQAFKKIQDATGISDIEELVQSFLTAEDQNYTLYNYVNDLNQEVEKLEDQINLVRAEINKYTEQSSGAANTEWQAREKLQQQYEKVHAQALLYEGRYENATHLMELMKSSILNIFNKIGCNTMAVRNLLGGEDITEANMLAYLGIIEQRANELLQAYAVSCAPQSPNLKDMLIAQPVAPSNTRIVIEPPSSLAVPDGGEGADKEDQEGDQGPDDMPLTREVLEAKVQKNLEKMLETSLKIKSSSPDAKKSPKKL